MKYSKSLVKQICDELATGHHTIADTCKKVGITESTFYHWKETKSEFLEAIKEAEAKRLESFKNMAISGLATLLTKHEVTEEKTEFEKDENTGLPTPVKTVKTRKTLLPNPTAVIFTLTNRDPDNWKHKQNVDHTSDGKGFFDFLTEASQEENGEE